MTWAWAKGRHVPHLLAATAVLGAAAAVLGSTSVGLPTLDPDNDGVDLWRVLTVIAATTPALALASALGDLEAAAADRYTALATRLLTAAGACHLILFLTLATLPATAPHAAVLARAWAGWCGLALISATLLRPQLAWVGPIAGLSALVFWGSGGINAGWWELDARPPTDLATWALATALLAAGLLARWATPWRRHRRHRGHQH